MAPIVHGLEAEFDGQIEFVYLDVDDAKTKDFKNQLGYRYQPHFFLLDGEGNVLMQWLGPVTEEDFRSAFAAALGQ
ncbi:MAG: hypothetical protein MAG431_02375 [Chloroflexi bacterium]|nr:hypothetical protein [Chloroflexota bacterium]